MNWRWIGDERRKMIGIGEKIKKELKEIITLMRFISWDGKGTWKEIWVTESVSREDE